MSTVIDERVVEMRFDNKQFESNVATSMSTLEKLKQKLNLSGASKGLEDINNASKKINMSGLGNGIDAVSAKFSALQVVGVTALANITNQAVNAGKRIVSALTIDPITSGFKEYETQINATQTILANTKSKGSTIDDVNNALEELNKYADLTIYNFTEMTRNIGTFTAAGVDLETSVNAIKGIANLAAVSGSTSQQASTAMYQLSQALASGTVKLMDWNSVVNAGMGGELFQNALKETSELLGTGAEAAIKAEGSFRESLRTGWLTSEVLTETLKKFTTSGANEYIAKYTGLTEKQIAAEVERAKKTGDSATAMDRAAESIAKLSGKSKEEIKNALDFAQTAEDAATKVKTFTQLWDVMKEAAQSGWAQTWKIIVGDFEEAKNLLSPLADFFTGAINKMSEWRNDLLESALGKGFSSLVDKVNDVLKPATKAADAVKNVTGSVADLDKVVEEVIRGDWGNWDDRFNALTKAGHNYMVVQNKVNETLGDTFRYSDERIAAQEKVIDTQSRTTDAIKDETKATTELTDKQKSQLKSMARMTDSQMLAKGYTKEQIAAFKELKRTAEQLGIPFDDFIDNLDEINGRWLLINSFKNIGKSLVKVFSAIGKAWREVFNPIQAESIFDIIAAFHKFTASLVPSEDTVEKLVRTFKGLFAVLDIVKTILTGGIRIAFKILSAVLGAFDLDILDVTASIGDAIVKFHEWLESVFDISGVLEVIVPIVKKVANSMNDWFKSFKESEGIRKVSEYIKKLSDNVRDWWSSLKDSEDLPKTIAEGIINAFTSIPKIISTVFSNIWDAITGSFAGVGDNPIGGVINKIRNSINMVGQTMAELGRILLEKLNKFLSAHGFKEISEDSIAGLVNGFKEGAVKVWNAAVELAKGLVEKVKNFLGIHSPSTVFAAIGGFIIAGLIAGLQNGIPDSLAAIKDVFQPMLDWIKTLDLGSIIAAALGVGTVGTVYKGVSALDKLASPLEGLDEVFKGTRKVLEKSAKPIAKVIKSTASVVKSFSKVLNGVAFDIKADGIMKLGKTLLMLVAAIAILTLLDPKELWNAVAIVAVLAAILVGLVFAVEKLNKASVSLEKGKGLNIDGLNTSLIGIGAAILLMAVALKMIGSMNPDQLKQGFLGLAGVVVALGVVIAAFGLFVKGSSAENIDKLGGTMRKLGVALLIMALTAKILGGMDLGELIQGGIAIVAFAGVMVGLMAATKLISNCGNVDVIGSTLLKISFAIAVMGLVAKLLGGMDLGELIQGGIAIAAFAGIMVGLMAATKLISDCGNVDVIGSTLLKISLAIGVMALVAKLLGGMDQHALIQGGIAIAAFSGIIVGLMAATKLISNCGNVDVIGSTLLKISGAIAIMALTAFMLSMISWDGFAKGTIMITAFAGIMVGLIAATKLVGGSNNVEHIGKTLIMISGAITVLAVVATLLGLVPEDNLKRGVAAVAVLATLMSGLIAATKNASECVGTIVALTVAIAVMTGAIYLISRIPAESAMASAIALGSLMLVMAGVLLIVNKVGKNAKAAIKGIIALTSMAVPLLAFVGVLALMKNVNASRSTIESLIILIGAMTLLLIPLTLVGKYGSKAIKGIIALTAMAAPLLAFVGVLALMKNVNTSMATIQSLVLLVGAMSLLLIPLTIIGRFAASALIGVLALTAMAIPMLAFIGIIALMNSVENATTNAMLIGSFMTTIADVLFKISLVAPLAVVADVAISGLMVVMTAFGALATAVGALMEQFPSLQRFLDTGIPVLEQLAGAIGTVIGELLGGIITGVGNAIVELLPKLGIALSAFMVGLQPFITLVDNVDASILEKVGYVTAAILLLTAADFLASIVQFCGMSFEELGAQLSAFGTGAAGFFDLIKGVDSKAVEAAKNVSDMILALSLSQLIDTITSFLGGEVDYASLGENLKTFGEAVVGFSDTINGKINEDAVAAAANAGMMLADLNNALPRSGGLLQDLLGEKDFTEFATSCKAFANAMIEVNESVSQEGFEFQSDKIQQIVDAGTKFNDLNTALPKTGGIAQDLAGETDLAGFGSACKAFVDCMILVNDSISSEEFVVQADKIDQLANAGTKFNDLNTALPKTGGIAQDFAGEKDLSGFGASVAAFAACMITVNAALSQEGFVINLDAIESLKQAGLKMNELQGALPEEGGWWEKIAGSDKQSLTEFGENIANFADSIVSFSDKSIGLDADAINNALICAGRIKNVITNLADMDTGGLETFTGIGTGAVGADGAAYAVAEAMVAFSDKVTGINTEAVTVAVAEAGKLRNLISNLVDLDTSGIENFTPDKIADEMKNFADKVAEIDTTKVASSISSAGRLRVFISELVNLDSSGIVNFKIDSIATSLKNYGTNVASVNFKSIDSSIDSATRVGRFITSLTSLNTSGVSAFTTAVSELSTVNIADLVKAFSGASGKFSTAGSDIVEGLYKGMRSKIPAVKQISDKIVSTSDNAIKAKLSVFTKAGANIATSLAKGFDGKKKTVATAVTSCITSAADKIKGKYTAFYNAGEYLVKGFASGIDENTWRAKAKAKAMAEAAVEAAKKALKINSPSRVFKAIGAGIPEGFAMGISMLNNRVDRSVTTMASTAITTTKSAMANVLDALNSDMDMQPTIRPVVDLSDVQTGVGAIRGMFISPHTIGVRANLNAASSVMNAKLQNGSNDDIISAINKLNDGLENNRGDTYNFGNFTYDDGTNISEAVHTLMRAAKMGRRV